VIANLPTQGLSASDPWVYGCSLGFGTDRTLELYLEFGVGHWYHFVLGRKDWRTQQRGNES
jgi:hypothetical protein